jgi:hypothetical protein
MKFDSVGEIIATREFDLDGEKKVNVFIGKPQTLPHEADWFCTYQIAGIGSGGVKYAGGIDPVQALVLALSLAGAHLYSSAEYEAGRLSWDCATIKGDLGFPVPNIMKDDVPGTNNTNGNNGNQKPTG